MLEKQITKLPSATAARKSTSAFSGITLGSYYDYACLAIFSSFYLKSVWEKENLGVNDIIHG